MIICILYGCVVSGVYREETICREKNNKNVFIFCTNVFVWLYKDKAEEAM